MFSINNCEQRSEEWFNARLGNFTASSFSKVITTKGKKSTSINGEINRCAAELITGEKEESYSNSVMDRGSSLEDEALSYINMAYSHDFREVGFLKSNDGNYGCSPDGIDLEKKIGLEMKCPLAKTQIDYLISGTLPTKYILQVQGSMLVTGFNSWIFVSYHPSLKPLYLVIERDEFIINSLKDVLIESTSKINEIVSKFKT